MNTLLILEVELRTAYKFEDRVLVQDDCRFGQINGRILAEAAIASPRRNESVVQKQAGLQATRAPVGQYNSVWLCC